MADVDAVNLGFLKAQCKRFVMDTTSAQTKLFASGLDLSRCAYQVQHAGNAIGVDVELKSDNDISLTATGGDLTGLKLLVWELPCDETTV